MRLTALRHLKLFAIAAGLAWSAMSIEATAQQGAAPSQDSQQRSRDNDDGDDGDGDEESRSVQSQMQAVKRELRGQKVDLSQAAPVRDRRHQFQLRVPNYIQIRQRNIVMQQRDFSCGAACFATICRYYWGDNVTEDKVLTTLDLMLTAEETEDRIKNGLAMSDLRRAAVRLGYQSVVGKTTFAKLTEVKLPVIVGIEPSGHKHFVVYRGADEQWVYMADPIRGNIRMPIWEFVDQWQENAVLVIHKPGQKIKQQSALSLTEADVELGDLNDFLIQTQQSRQPQYKQTIPP